MDIDAAARRASCQTVAAGRDAGPSPQFYDFAQAVPSVNLYWLICCIDVANVPLGLERAVQGPHQLYASHLARGDGVEPAPPLSCAPVASEQGRTAHRPEQSAAGSSAAHRGAALLLCCAVPSESVAVAKGVPCGAVL